MEKFIQKTIHDLIGAIKKYSSFTPFIGAGISNASGIPLAGEIWRSLGTRLYEKYNNSTPENIKLLEEWLYKQPFFREENPYASILDVALINREERKLYFQSIISGKSPSQAHNAISKLMTHGYAKVVVTTNFDRLMEYSIINICSCMPIIVFFDEIPEYVNMNSLRPKVFKLHGDYLFGNIQNLDREIYLVKKSMSEKIRMIAYDGPLVVAGGSLHKGYFMHDCEIQ